MYNTLVQKGTQTGQVEWRQDSFLPTLLQNALRLGVATDFVNDYPIVTIQTLVSLKTYY